MKNSWILGTLRWRSDFRLPGLRLCFFGWVLVHFSIWREGGRGVGTHDADDTFASGAFGEFARVQDVAGFAGAVAEPVVLADFVVEVAHIDAALWGIDLGAAGGHPNDANAVGRGGASCLDENREEKFGEEERGYVVSAELQVVALFGFAA